MNAAWILALSFGLAMDAFAVSVTNGMCRRMPLWKNALSSGLAFGLFQGLMPLLGFVAGHAFSGFVQEVDHWIAFGLLGFIGGRMLWEAWRSHRSPEPPDTAKEFNLRTLLVQAVATSIDAMAVGVSLGVMQVNLAVTIGSIMGITFLCSFTGVLLGKTFGRLLQNKAEVLGGMILIFIGVHILAEHLMETVAK